MRYIVLCIAMSLDGYLADEAGDVGWLEGDGSDDGHPGSYPAFIRTVDTVVMGYRTYRKIVTQLSPDSWPYPGKTCYVLTHQRRGFSGGISFTDRALPELLTELKQGQGKDIWICGGASVVNQLIGLDLIDRFCITVVPVILGAGIPLFAQHDRAVRLKLLSTQSYNGMTDLVYERRV